MKIELQVVGSALRAVAEEMGVVLIRSAFSANIKERRDCSTALFDADGRMIAQAEHIPVHLGAMPEAVEAARALDPGPGEIVVVNDPFTGGTHLPDITLVSRTEVGFAVSRAHHADVGGMEPASLPAESTSIYQEGVVIPPVRLTDDLLRLLVANMRNADERRGDLRAQVAAHGLAERRLVELCERRGHAQVIAAMDQLHAYSERSVRAAIAALPDGRYEAEDVLEPIAGELVIHAAVTIRDDEIDVDFAGTSPQHDGNLNCPLAVTRSATYFVVRALTVPDLPASGGAYAPVTVRAEPGSLLNARSPAAVVAGNTETSSRIVDTLFRAFGAAVPAPAQGQGTMNNLTFGNRRFTYYETIGGGQGGCPGGPGPSAVHVAMSNALNTPAEALELAYPLRVERYALRSGSGGAGRYPGGDGVVRELRVLEPCRMSILSERRAHAPQGAQGGGAGIPRAQPPERRGAPRQGDPVACRRRRRHDRDARWRRLRSAAPMIPIAHGRLHDQAPGRARAPLAEVATRPQVARRIVVRTERHRSRTRRPDPRARRGRARPGGGLPHPRGVADPHRRRLAAAAPGRDVRTARPRASARGCERRRVARAGTDHLGATHERLRADGLGVRGRAPQGGGGVVGPQ